MIHMLRITKATFYNREKPIHPIASTIV